MGKFALFLRAVKESPEGREMLRERPVIFWAVLWAAVLFHLPSILFSYLGSMLKGK